MWNSQTSSELLRIDVAGVECLCVAIARDGKSIVSGWKDSKIRAFTPETGKLMYTIHDAHPGEVPILNLQMMIIYCVYIYIRQIIIFIMVFILQLYNNYTPRLLQAEFTKKDKIDKNEKKLDLNLN